MEGGREAAGGAPAWLRNDLLLAFLSEQDQREQSTFTHTANSVICTSNGTLPSVPSKLLDGSERTGRPAITVCTEQHFEHMYIYVHAPAGPAEAANHCARACS
jgi:hypothetical protein